MRSLTKRPNRYHDHLAAAKAIAYLLILMGAIILVPLLLLAAPRYHAEISNVNWFIFPGVLSILAGFIIKFLTQGTRVRELRKFYGYIIVLELWIIAGVLGAVPFLMSREFNFTQAVFESMSGLTTTGFTLFPYEHAGHLQMLILYRSLLHLVGGVGLVLVLTTILNNAYGMQIFSAEGHTDRLTPSPLHSARTILLIYLGFIATGTIAFVILGMDWFDAINYAISAVATGGFSPHPDSLAHYHQVLSQGRAIGIDIVAMLLMLLGATNFMASMYFFKGRWRGFFRHIEVECTTILILLASPVVIADYMVHHLTATANQDVVSGLFLVVSTISTTGLTTVGNDLKALTFGLIPIFLLMMVGGHSDSTAGGIKSSRAAIAFHSIHWDIWSSLEPKRAIMSHQINRFGTKEDISDEECSQNSSYVLLYFLIIIAGATGLMFCGYDFKDSFVEFASALGTIGISIGVISRATPTPGLWIIIIGMLIARLEIYIFIFSFARIRRNIIDFYKENQIARRERRDREEARRKLRKELPRK